MLRNSVLIVDDDETFLSEIRDALCASGFEVLIARNAREARAIFESEAPAVSLIDRKLPDLDGQDLIKELSARYGLAKFVIITAHASFESAVQGIENGISDYIVKPVSLEELMPKIERLLEQAREEKVHGDMFKDYENVLRKYVTLFEHSTDAILVTSQDEDLVVLEINSSASALTGYSKERVVSRKISELPFTRAASFQKVLKEVKEKKEVSSEVEIQTESGAQVPVALTTARYELDNKRYVQFILHDLTAIKKAEEKTLKTERRYQNIINIVPGIVYIMNLKDMRTIYVNERIKPVLGYDSSEFTSEKDLRIACIHPDDRQRYVEKLENARETGQLEVVYRMLHSDGETVKWFKDVGVVTYEEDKNRLLLNGIVVDITFTKSQQERSSMLSTVVKDISESVVITDTEGVIVHCNNAASDNFGYSQEELIGKNDKMLFSELNLPGLFREMRDAIDNHHSWKGEVICRRSLGESFPAMMWIDPWRDEEDQLKGSVKIITDITEKRILEDELRRYAQRLERRVEERTEDLKKALAKVEKANRELKRQDSLKSKFVSNLAHELINPLAVIKDSIYLIDPAGNNFLDDKQKKIMQAAKRQTERLIRFATNMLDLSKIESGVFPMNRQEVDISSLVNDIALQYGPQAGQSNVSLHVDIKDIPDVIWADADLLEEVFINLLNNAIKYSPENGNVYLSVFKDGSKICFKIKDQGPGISEEDKDKIFDKYYRILKGGEKGTGLGLSIVKEIVGLHKGEIELISQKGEGCTFLLTLPIDLRNEGG